MVGHIRWGRIQSDRVNITKKILASNSTVFSATLLCLEFSQIDWCHIILSPCSWFSIFFEVLKRAHHSSGNTGPTSSPLDHSAVSLSKQTDIVHSQGCQLDSCDIARYTDQCCIGLKGQSEFSTIGDLLMLPRAFKNLGLQKLRFTFIAMEQRVRAWYRLPHVNKLKKACCVLGFRKVHSVCSNRARLKYC